ncbi:MAG: hypothetical protein M5U25_16260 [Planctomycetota bacterium]|nr:hypothetical protein [Planctomycetota bacterium]
MTTTHRPPSARKEESHDRPLGCPACGSGKFSAWQGYTEWGSEKLYCHYTGDIEDDEDYETDDYGDRHSSDSESGDMEDTRVHGMRVRIQTTGVLP